MSGSVRASRMDQRRNVGRKTHFTTPPGIGKRRKGGRKGRDEENTQAREKNANGVREGCRRRENEGITGEGRREEEKG